MLLDNTFKSDARVEKECEILVNNNYEVIVVCVKDSALPLKEERNGYQILRLLDDRFNSPLKKGFNDYIDSISQEIADFYFDVLHCHDFYMLHIGAKVKSIKPEIKLLYDSHEYLEGWPFYKNTNNVLIKFKGYLVWKKLILNERKDIRKADKVITITKSIAEKLQSNSSLQELPVVIGNYPKTMQIKTDKEYFHQKFNLAKDTKVMVQTGTIYQDDEQLNDLFEIVKSQENLVLVFIGNRARFYEVQKWVEASDDLNTKIFFHEYLSNQNEIINLLSCADIGLMHLNDTWEAHKLGFSNRFAEYVLAKIPVVATPQEFTKEVNDQYNCCVFYSEKDVTKLKMAIEELMNNYSLYKQNVLKATEVFNWETESTKLTNLYNKI